MIVPVLKRFPHLSLTVLLALALAVPAAAREYAVGTPEESAELLAAELPPAAEEDPAELLEIRQAKVTLEDPDQPLSLMSEGTAFSLDNGTQVSGDTDASGTGWAYNSAKNELTLTEPYNGTPVSVYCGLTLRIEGDVTIAAPDSEGFGSSAIYHALPADVVPTEENTLVIEVSAGSSLTVKGGYGLYGGGSAIRSNYNISIDSEGTVVLTGGDSYYPGYTSSGEGKHAYAGDGINAVDIILSGSNISVTGGSFRTANASYGYAGSGLFAKGHLSLTGSNFTAKGGNASYSAGHGADVGTITVQADSTSFSGGIATALGGYGIFAEGNINFTSGSVTARGGDASTTSGSGGRGAASLASIYVNCNCTLTGGNGYKSAAGITYGKICYFGLANATVQGKGITGVHPVTYYTGASTTISYHDHVHSNTSNDKTTLTVRINEYEMILDGNGGTFNGNEQFTDVSPYPTYYDLAEYPFTLSGYALMGWGTSSATTETSDNLLPLNARVHPKADKATLYAVWASTDFDNLIILNGLEGRLEDNYLYKFYMNHSVTLPSTLDYSDGNRLLAWSTEIIPAEDENTHMFSGRWFSGGDEITPQENTPTLLYGQTEHDGSYVLYHPNGGTFVNGGTLLVQGTRAADSDLQVSIPDGSCLTAPEGLVFTGWTTSANGTAQYDGGDSLTLKGGTVTHLYACWEPAPLETVTSGLTISFRPHKKTVQITVPEGWNEAADIQQMIAGLFTEDGRLLQTDLGIPGTDLELTYTAESAPVLRVFALNGTQKPAVEKTELALSSLLD